MPKFQVLMRVDAYVSYQAEIDAVDAAEAADLAYDNASSYKWECLGTEEFDARHVVTLDESGNEIEVTKWGKG